MSNSYENEINELVDGIMKVAEEASASTGMEKEAGIFNRKRKSELSANKAKADEMFSGQGGDDSASDPKGKVQRKWKRIKAKFFKRANENTEEMIEKIAAAAGTEVDMLLDYIEKIAAEEDLDGQDIVDTLYEDIEDEDYEDEDYEDEDYEDEDDEDEDYEDYGEEVEASMINDAMEKIAAVAGMDEETVADYIVAVAAENEIDELEVLAAMEDEADEVLEKEAGLKDMGDKIRNSRPVQFAGRKKAQMGEFAGKHSKGLKIGGGITGAAALAGAGYGGYKYMQKRKARAAAEAEKEAFEVLIDEAIEKVAYVAGVDCEDVLDYVEKLAYENDLDEIEVLAELEKEAGLKDFAGKARAAVMDKVDTGRLHAMYHPNITKGIAGAGIAAAGTGAYLLNKKRKARAAAEAEKEAFEVLIDEAIEKVAYVAGVDGEDVLDYVEKLAYENDLDEIEVLAELEKEAAPKFMEGLGGKIKTNAGNVLIGRKNIDNYNFNKSMQGTQATLGGSAADIAAELKDFRKAKLGLAKRPAAIGAGLAAAGYGGYKYRQKRKARRAEESEE